MSAPPAFRISAATSAISALSMAMTTSAASSPRKFAPGASFPRARLLVEDLRARIAFDLLFVTAISGQYSEWFTRFNNGPLQDALQCRSRGLPVARVAARGFTVRYIMKQVIATFILLALYGAVVYADDAPASAASTSEQAQARQFGIYFGGMASQYDLCVKKGFLVKGNQSAEEAAKSILE